MLNSLPQQDAADNQRSLSTLGRAIALAQDRFSLIFARCNYQQLRAELLTKLREQSPVEFRELVLPESAKSLGTAIQAEINSEPPAALMVLGLEDVDRLNDLLSNTNQLRDEFRNHFPFPVVLWVTDEVLQKLSRLAPDFHNWAAIPIQFIRDPEVTIQTLRQEADGMFTKILDGSGELVLSSAFSSRAEVEAALKDLQSYGRELEPDLAASLQFILGEDDCANGKIDAALEQYRQSLEFWQQTHNLERQGVLLFYIGRCYSSITDKRLRDNNYHNQAKAALEKCLEVFEQAQRPDLVAKYITYLGEVLQQLELWEELQSLAQKSLKLHDTDDTILQLARDYGFLASVALARSNWTEANQHATKALQTLELATESQQQYRGLYFLLLARSQHHLGQLQSAVVSLETARQNSVPQADPQLYIEILTELRSLYFQQSAYLAAFDIKQEQRVIETQYGFRSFIGAGRLQPQRKVGQQDADVALEIAASGRQRDVNCLIERLSLAHHKLIVICGPSGVGKSSLLTAGLVPSLQQIAIGEQTPVPVVLQTYSDWVGVLSRELAAALEKSGSVKTQNLAPLLAASDAAVILERLRKNGDRNLLTVLIFDQFEEFFFVDSDTDTRQTFFTFLRDCLNLPFVKVILSLREDYRHYLYYLLEWNYQQVSGGKNDILNGILREDIRYYLGNFSTQEAASVMKELTARAQFPVESALISQLVQDLADENGEVRPIELQLVGSQLQEDNITTLQEYQQLGDKPKAKLVERSILAVIKDCGSENADAAWKVLALLTDEKGTRPLRTQDELATALRSQANHLDLILNILVGAGLVFRLREDPEDRYQLVHDYLVEPIRQTYDFDRDKRLLKAEEDKKLSDQQLIQVNRDLKKRLRELRLAVKILGVSVVIFVGLLLYAAYQANERSKAEIRALNSLSRAVLTSHDQLGALIEAVKAGKQLQRTWGAEDIKPETEQTLQNVIVSNIQERDRLQEHTDWVYGVSFSPDGQTIASTSIDKTVKLWRRDGTLPRTLKGHNHEVYSVSFSPNGQTLASGDSKGFIKLWQIDGTPIQTIQGHKDWIYRVSFSPNGQMLASASGDGTIKLWRITDGKLLQSFKGYKTLSVSVNFSSDNQFLSTVGENGVSNTWRTSDGKLMSTVQLPIKLVKSVKFSPNGQLIASDDNSRFIKVWRRDGTLLNTLAGQDNSVSGFSFSPNNQILASADSNGVVKLWRLSDSTLLQSFQAHSNYINSISFSPDGQTLASASEDNSVKLWQFDSNFFQTLAGHDATLYGLSFSPDKKLIASTSSDGAIKLWSSNGLFIKDIQESGDPVNAISFTPDSKTIAAASNNNGTIKIWSIKGKLIQLFKAHNDAINSISFSANGETVASGSDDGTIALWSRNLRTGFLEAASKKKLNHSKDSVLDVSFSPDGKLLASASADNTIKLWSQDGRLLETLKGHNAAVRSVSFSPDSQTLASASADNTIKLWSQDGRLLETLRGHNAAVFAVSFSSDGKTLASASADKTIKLWQRDGGILLRTLQGHRDVVYSLSFSPNRQTLASASWDKQVILWNLKKIQSLSLNRLLVDGCNRLQPYLKTNPNTKEARHLCKPITSTPQA